MRNRIFRYLEQQGKPLTSAEILQEILRIHSPNAQAADHLLAGIMGKDPRFRRDAGGNWRIVRPYEISRSTAGPVLASLFIEISPDRRHVRGSLLDPGQGQARSFDIALEETRQPSSPLRLLRHMLSDQTLVLWRRGDLHLWHRLLRRECLPLWQGSSLFLRDLAEALFPDQSPRAGVEDLAGRLSLAPPDRSSPEGMARFLVHVAEQLMALLPPEVRNGDLQEWIRPRSRSADFGRFGFDAAYIRGLPARPGVYLMRNRAGDLIYVGKARSLRPRVASYFTRRALKNPKVQSIHLQLHSLEVLPTGSEVEALLMEIRLIRDFRPVLNQQIEVHERSESYGKKTNLLLLVPDTSPEHARVYLLSKGAFVGEALTPLGKAPARKLREMIRRQYYCRGKGAKRPRPGWEIEIIATWLKSNRRRLNYIDIDEAGSPESVFRSLTLYLRDPDLWTRKTYYR